MAASGGFVHNASLQGGWPLNSLTMLDHSHNHSHFTECCTT